MSEEVKTVLDELGSKFEDFKSENKTRLDEIEKKGHADPLLQDKVDKMSDDIAELAEVKLAHEIQQKNLEEATAKIESLETVLARQNASASKDVDIQTKAFGEWLRKGEVDEMERKALYE